MTCAQTLRTARSGCLALFFLTSPELSLADDSTATVTRDQLLQLQQQNQQMQQQLEKQQQLIDLLTHKVSEIQAAQSAPAPTNLESNTEAEAAPAEQPFQFGHVALSGEGGLAFFYSQPGGQTPNPEFRIDEARLFIDAPVWDDVFFYSEVDLATRESSSLNLQVGELYLDFENLSRLWNCDRLLNLRVGRFYIPFGEEYQERFAIDNPLISHSVSDLWGADNGVQIYGARNIFTYNLAVQNGGSQPTADFTGDKSVTGRIGCDPNNWLHLSVSGMRTGEIDAQNEVLSALWFGNGFFRSIGSPGTTRFKANLVEGDVQAKLPFLQLKTAGGYINYSDNDPLGSNHRDVYYYYVEGLHDLTQKFYLVARWSQVFANNGFPIVGNGPMGTYLFGELTSDYWRLSLGAGYAFTKNLVVKAEYSFNQGVELDGTPRDQENLVAMEAAFAF
jgi:hypothetical protein